MDFFMTFSAPFSKPFAALFGGGADFSLPYSIDFTTQPDGALPSVWYAPNAAISGGVMVNTPTLTEKVVNGNFSAWTGGNPNNWSLSAAETAGHYVEEVPAGQCHLVSDLANWTLLQNCLTANKWYYVSIDVKAVADSSMYFRSWAEAAIWEDISTTGIKVYERWLTNNSTGELWCQSRNVPTDITFDDISALEISGEFGFLPETQKDVTVKACLNVAATSTGAGVVGRADSKTAPLNYVVALYNRLNGRVELHKVVAGVHTLISTAVTTYVAGAMLELRISDTNYSIWYNNVEKIAATVIDEATINNNLIHGWISVNGGNSLNSFFCHSSTEYGAVFIGGSNTERALAGSWRLRANDYLDQRYTSNEYAAGVGGTSSWYGLVRLQADVIAHAPDVVFIEFAVNDAGHGDNTARANGWWPCAEAMIRRLRAALPNARLIMVNLVQQEEYVSSQGYIDSRDLWESLSSKYGLDHHRIDLWLQGVIGDPTPTQVQCEVYGDFVHFTDAGHEQIYLMLLPSALPDAYTGGANWTGDITDYDPATYADLADWMYDPIIRTGVDNDGETGPGWTTEGTARKSSTANDTIQWTGTFSSFGLDTNVGVGAGTLAWDIDGGGYTNINLSLIGNYHGIYSLARGPHTVTIKVVSGTVKINRFLAI